MWGEIAQIVAIEQPLQLLAGEAEYGLLAVQRPAETLGLQLLMPQTEAIALSGQTLHRGAPAVGEDVERLGERIASQLLPISACLPSTTCSSSARKARPRAA